MLQIQQITNDPLQQQTLVLPDGSKIQLTMYYQPQQSGWFIVNLTYGTFVLNGMRITVNPNMLRQWKNILTFGLACDSSREPTEQNDFASGTAKLFILTAAEVLAYEAFLDG